MAPRFRVLLVDDEPDLLEVVTRLLERAGPFQVEACGSAAGALDRLAAEPFDAVISDFQMPGMDGIVLLSLVRQRHGDLPFILFTGKGREQVVIRAINAGVDFYVQKGGDPAAQFAELAHQTLAAIERRAARRALHEREERFRALIQNSSDIIRIIGQDGLISYDSDSGSRILGYPPGSAIGHSPLEFVHPDDRATVRAALDEVYARTSPGTPTAFRVRHADGRWIPVESVASNLIGTPGVDGIVTTTWPVEARRTAEEALERSERLFERAEVIAGFGHWELDPDSGTIRASRGAQLLCGLGGDERTLVEAREAALPEYHPLIDRALERLVEEGQPLDLEFASRRPEDGSRRELRLNAEYDPERRRVFGILQDVTDRRRAEAALRAGEERYRTLAEDMPVYVCTFRPDGTLTYVNTALAALAGEAPEALVGRPFLDLIAPADRERLQESLGRLSSRHPVETQEQSGRTADGAPCWQQWTNRAVFDRDGRLLRYQAVGLDVTELRETEAALRRANRTLTLLSEITRHDIDNQLAVLRGYLSLALSEEGTPAAGAFLDRCVAASERIAALIRFASAWEGMGRPPAWMDLREMVEDAASEVETGGVQLQDDLPYGLRIWADPLCTRVLAGLIENAVRHGATVTTVRFSAGEADDGRLVVACEDDGIGVPAEAKERIFERGYGANTGLGLYLAREALNLTGIAIGETGTPGKGARFELAVPRGGWRRGDGNGPGETPPPALSLLPWANEPRA